jgi:hypothetical protein
MRRELFVHCGRWLLRLLRQAGRTSSCFVHGGRWWDPPQPYATIEGELGFGVNGLPALVTSPHTHNRTERVC